MNILLVFLCFIIVFIVVFCSGYKIWKLSAKPKNNVHFYVARDHDYSLNLYLGKPKRACYYFLSCTNGSHLGEATHFQRFGLNYNDFKDLKWENEPVEVFLNLDDRLWN